MTYTKESVERLVEACRTQATIYPATSMLLVAVLSSLTLETPRVCEWKDGSSRRGGPECFESGCGMTYSYGTRKTFKFCPYCGGEIKEATLTIGGKDEK